jgi:heat shock protein HspQ
MTKIKKKKAKRWVDEYYHFKLTDDDSSIQAAYVVSTNLKKNDNGKYYDCNKI